MIKMMSVMMELMSHMMLGGASNNSLPFSPASAMSMSSLPLSGMPMSGTSMAGLPMSPVTQLGSLYGNNQINKNPWLNIPTSNLLQQNQLSKQVQTQNDSINGIWQALSGDIIAIYFNSNFIWTDGKKRHLAGSLVVKGNQLSAFIPANNKVLNFQFYRQNNKFAVKDSSGQIHIFSRIH